MGPASSSAILAGIIELYPVIPARHIEPEMIRKASV
jgi:hypothetical protein